MIINTHGIWRKFEEVANTIFENGKTYKISVEGHCEFATSLKEPKSGINSNEIDFKASDEGYLWIRTK